MAEIYFTLSSLAFMYFWCWAQFYLDLRVWATCMLRAGEIVWVGDFFGTAVYFHKNNCNSLQETNDCRIPKSLFWPGHCCFSVILSLERFYQRHFGRVLYALWNLQVSNKTHCQNTFLTAPVKFICEVSMLKGYFHLKMKREIFFLAFYILLGLSFFYVSISWRIWLPLEALASCSILQLKLALLSALT